MENEIIYCKIEEKQKLKPVINAVYTGGWHFLHSGNWGHKEELSIYMSGIYAKIFGFLFQAKQY